MRFSWFSSRSATSSYRRTPDVAAVRHGDKLVLMDMNQEQFYSLDGVAGRVWEILADPVTVESMTDRLVIEYDAPRDLIRDDVVACLDQMTRDGLVRSGR